MSAPSFPVCINFKFFFFSGENKGVWGQVRGALSLCMSTFHFVLKTIQKKIQYLLVFWQSAAQTLPLRDPASFEIFYYLLAVFSSMFPNKAQREQVGLPSDAGDQLRKNSSLVIRAGTADTLTLDTPLISSSLQRTWSRQSFPAINSAKKIT